MTSEIARILADLILVLHWAFATFIVVGLVVIWLGRLCDWKFIRSRPMRLTHLGAMGIVVGESVMGIFCPLTEWESRLRHIAGQAAGYQPTFMEYWAGRLFYWDISEHIFMLIYISFFAAMLLTWLLIPPYKRTPRQDHTKGIAS